MLHEKIIEIKSKTVNNFGEEDILLGNDGWNPVKNGNELLKDLKR